MHTTAGLGALPSRLLLPALILAILVWRLAVAAILPVTQDEAYYYDWARSLAWGYFDHPPGVALLGLGTWLAPGSALAGRLGTLLAGFLTLIVLVRFYRNCGLQSPRDLALALLILVATLPGFAAGVVTTPDTPLTLAWALALHESERALAGERRRWLTAGLAVGLGLLGKYTMVLIGPVLLWAILRADPRALRTPWPYLGGLIALLVFAPNIIWNQQHDWLTMRFQFGHGFGTELAGVPLGSADLVRHEGPGSLVARLGSLLGYLGTQLAFWGLLLIPFAMALWKRRQDGGGRLAALSMAPHAAPLLWAGAVFPLAFCALLALGSEVEPNWPGMYLISAAPLVALALRKRRRWLIAGALGNLLLLGLFAAQIGTAAWPLGQLHPRLLRESSGFSELAQIVSELREPVRTERYQMAAMLRFHAHNPGVTQWPGLKRPSEYLRGAIAPKVDPTSVHETFWLVSGTDTPPSIAGFRSDLQRTFFACPGWRLIETSQIPCPRAVSGWHLYRYQPDR